MTGAEILAQQDEERALRLLGAQRCLYREAKRCLALQIVLLVILPGILSAWSLITPDVRTWAAIVAIAVLVVDVLVLEPRLRVKRLLGATVQEEFDVMLFRIAWPSWRLTSRPDPEIVRDAGDPLLSSAPERERLMGWYPAAIGRLTDLRAALVCQRFNITYGLRIRRPVALGLLLLVILMCMAFLAITLHRGIPLGDALLGLAVPSLPMLSWTWREYVRQRDHVGTQERIKGSIEKAIAEMGAGSLADAAAVERVRHLQSEILAARIADPLIFDWVYHLLRPANEKTMSAAAEDYVDELLRTSPPSSPDAITASRPGSSVATRQGESESSSPSSMATRKVSGK